jgi:hypothetical protein
MLYMKFVFFEKIYVTFSLLIFQWFITEYIAGPNSKYNGKIKFN